MNSVAILFPNVIVPVLSRRRTSTSPAASAARPLVAMTFLRMSLSIPLIPIALNNPPIVVGIKQTNNEISTGRVVKAPPVNPVDFSAYRTNAGSVATTSRKIIVNAESKIVRAISFGVFCRFDPSTKEIILSRNVFPGSDVTRIMILSLRTFVPPVTELRSSPLSRMTGADSPVIADSSTLAIPSIMTPSQGMIFPVSQMTLSPFFKLVAGTGFSPPLAV